MKCKDCIYWDIKGYWFGSSGTEGKRCKFPAINKYISYEKERCEECEGDLPNYWITLDEISTSEDFGCIFFNKR